MLNQFAVEIPTLPVDQCHSHFIQYLKECLSRSFRNAEPQRRAAKHLGHTWYIGKRFLQIQMRFLQHLIHKNCISGIHHAKSRSINPQWRKVKDKKKKNQDLRCQSWTVSQKFSHPQWRRLFKEFLGQTNNDCRFRIFISTNSLHQPRLLAGR